MSRSRTACLDTVIPSAAHPPIQKSTRKPFAVDTGGERWRRSPRRKASGRQVEAAAGLPTRTVDQDGVVRPACHACGHGLPFRRASVQALSGTLVKPPSHTRGMPCHRTPTPADSVPGPLTARWRRGACTGRCREFQPAGLRVVRADPAPAFFNERVHQPIGRHPSRCVPSEMHTHVHKYLLGPT